MKAAFVALVAAASMAATPALAASNTAASLSVAKAARAPARVAKGDKLGGSGSGRFLIAAAVTAAIIAGIFVAANEIGSDDPDSN